MACHRSYRSGPRRGLRAAFVATAVAALLIAARVDAKVFPFTAILNGPQETPPVTTTAQGVAVCTFDSATGMLSYAISYNGLSSAEVAAHFHGPAPIGTPPRSSSIWWQGTPRRAPSARSRATRLVT